MRSVNERTCFTKSSACTAETLCQDKSGKVAAKATHRFDKIGEVTISSLKGRKQDIMSAAIQTSHGTVKAVNSEEVSLKVGSGGVSEGSSSEHDNEGGWDGQPARNVLFINRRRARRVRDFLTRLCMGQEEGS